MRIYFDHNATTPLDPAVADAVAAALRDDFGNPSSVHHFGQRAKRLVDDARAALAALIGAEPSEVIFTSGGTEADNLALRGAADVLAGQGRRHLIASAIEHEAVLNTLQALQRHGSRVTLLPVDAHGIVSPDDLRAAIDDETCLVSVMHANNEIGTIQPVAELAAIAHDHGALFHTDAVQSVGKVPVDVETLGVDLLSLSAHKFNGPKGVGALWLRRGVRLSPTQTGGRHERSRRAGTENVPALVGMGVAARTAVDRLASTATPLTVLRGRLEDGILGVVSGTTVNGAREPRVPNTSNISFESVEAESLLIGLDLDGIAVSTGSACSSGTLEPSHVLRAMGLPHHRVQSSIRFSLGLGNTDLEVDRTIAVLPGIVGRLRDLTRASTRSRPAASGAGR
ncbi:MAG: cysteine desulfurase family protein [Vicinamibacterales bacterium]|jgi:cysteine desulfurase|nr:cysteine desulfurase NifS [Acidobacteriota bacterium]MDP6373080.1 cysteine desulfurase family protein [Vicinamibacterales bacterium]MDP6608433.1 cysteine desulfurase family protein [Vicinamibacterales bacterium]HAK55299.1 cysteine desulfurase NifS [Acidobacteriota bacterium]|tara:strand:+ start:2978 stop:4168 length:1191 start_codon:yes stop_codon:yes gene_type:complete